MLVNAYAFLRGIPYTMEKKQILVSLVISITLVFLISNFNLLSLYISKTNDSNTKKMLTSKTVT